MRVRFNINGDLWYDMLDHFALISYDYSYKHNAWVALTRSYRKDGAPAFITYMMDEHNVFKTLDREDGREPLILAAYKKRFDLKPDRSKTLPRPPKDPDFIWRKGMTAGEWDRLNGPHAVRHLLDDDWVNS